MHRLHGALPEPYVPVAVTAHLYTYSPPRCRTLQYCRTFFLLSVFLWNDLADPVFYGVGLAGFKSRANTFYWPQLLDPYYSRLLFFPFSLPKGWYCGAGVFRLIGFNHPLSALTAELF